MSETQRSPSYKLEKYFKISQPTPLGKQESKLFPQYQVNFEGQNKQSISRQSKNLKAISNNKSESNKNEIFKLQNQNIQEEISQFKSQQNKNFEILELQKKYNFILTQQQQDLLRNQEFKQNFWNFYGIIQKMDNQITTLNKLDEICKREHYKVQQQIQCNHQFQIDDLNEQIRSLIQDKNHLNNQNVELLHQIEKEKYSNQKLEEKLKYYINIELENEQQKQSIMSLLENIQNLENQLKKQSQIFYQSQYELQNVFFQTIKETFPKLDFNNAIFKLEKSLQDQLKNVVIINEKTIDSNIQNIEDKMHQFQIKIQHHTINEDYFDIQNQINLLFEDTQNKSQNLEKALEDLIKKNEKINWNSNSKDQSKIIFLQKYLQAFKTFQSVFKKLITQTQFIIDQSQKFNQCQITITFNLPNSQFTNLSQNELLKTQSDCRITNSQLELQQETQKTKNSSLLQTEQDLVFTKDTIQNQKSTCLCSEQYSRKSNEIEQSLKVNQEMQTDTIKLQFKEKAMQTQSTAQVCGRCKYSSIATQEITLVVKCPCWLFGNKLKQAKEITI